MKIVEFSTEGKKDATKHQTQMDELARLIIGEEGEKFLLPLISNFSRFVEKVKSRQHEKNNIRTESSSALLNLYLTSKEKTRYLAGESLSGSENFLNYLEHLFKYELANADDFIQYVFSLNKMLKQVFDEEKHLNSIDLHVQSLMADLIGTDEVSPNDLKLISSQLSSYALTKLLGTMTLPPDAGIAALDSNGYVSAGVKIKNYILILDYYSRQIITFNLEEYKRRSPADAEDELPRIFDLNSRIIIYNQNSLPALYWKALANIYICRGNHWKISDKIRGKYFYKKAIDVLNKALKCCEHIQKDDIEKLISELTNETSNDLEKNRGFLLSIIDDDETMTEEQEERKYRSIPFVIAYLISDFLFFNYPESNLLITAVSLLTVAATTVLSSWWFAEAHKKIITTEKLFGGTRFETKESTAEERLVIFWDGVSYSVPFVSVISAQIFLSLLLPNLTIVFMGLGMIGLIVAHYAAVEWHEDHNKQYEKELKYPKRYHKILQEEKASHSL
ncbi:MAG: hypothetical protein ABII74_04925 [Elusimicrobiota bacterium]